MFLIYNTVTEFDYNITMDVQYNNTYAYIHVADIIVM